MKKTVIVLSAVLGVVLAAVFARGLTADAEDKSAIKSLRGDVPLTQEPRAPEMRDYRKDHPVEARSYVQQPPLIPHTVRDYRITADHNKCMECHSWARYREFGATKVSMTHFKDRSGADTATISALRYFCTQCHVPQADARPLVENTFRPIEAIRQAK